MAFENPFALLALLSIIPLIILYLLKPKPLEIKIPSIMFLMQSEEDKKRFFTSIRKLIKDPLFLIQLLVLILLAFAAAAPYIITYSTISDEHTVIVMDSSASMQANGRFEEAVKKANEYVSKSNSVVLAYNTPVVFTDSDGSQNTKDTLNSLKPGSTTADLAAAIDTGTRLLAAGGGRIIVLSDFASWDGEDPTSAKNLAESQGIKVEFVQVGKSIDNVGIIRGQLQPTSGGYNYNCIIKNYGNSALNIPITINTGNNTYNTQLSINGKLTQEFVVNNISRGLTTIKINRDDSLITDNTAYISVPFISERNVLFISDQNILPSMTATALIPGIKTSLSSGIPVDVSKYNVIVISNITHPLNSDETTILNNYVNNGGKVVFIASNSLIYVNTDIQQLLPVQYMNLTQTRMGVKFKANQRTLLTDDINLDEIAVYRYIEAKAKLSATNLITTEKGTPLLSYNTIGKGTVVYVGFADYVGENAWTNFHNTPTYPVFWFKLIGWLGGSGDIEEYNLNTGATYTLATEQSVSTPSGIQHTNKVSFTDAGIYKVAGKDIAANLYNDKESDTTLDGTDVMQRSSFNNKKPSLISRDYEIRNSIDIWLIVIGILLLLVELYIIRKRGEL